MMHQITVSFPLHKILTLVIALVWLINGLVCKLLNLVPRHQLIVSQILGKKHAGFFTKTIGFSELLMAAWIVSELKPQLCAMVQMIIVAAMNIIEFIAVPGLLLFGRINILVAAFFIVVVYCNTFVLPNFINH